MPTRVKPIQLAILGAVHPRAAEYAELVGSASGVQLAGCFDEDGLLDPDIDAVVICSEIARRRDLVIGAAEAGKSVLCEVPFSTVVSDGIEMVQYCRDKGAKLQAGLVNRFNPEAIRAKRAMGAGELGRILSLRASCRTLCPADWRTDLSFSGGGAVMDLAGHAIDLMCWVSGSAVTEVYGEVSNLVMHKGYDDSAVLSLTLSNDIMATLDVGWLNPRSDPTLSENVLKVIGTGGSISVDLRSGDNEAKASIGLLESFTKAIAEDVPIAASGEDGLAATAAVLAAYESALRGVPVRVASMGAGID